MVTEIKLLPCPFCGGEAIVVKTESCGRYIGCWDCGGRTEEFETDYAGSAHDKAIAAWNRRAEQNNTPLALDEIISRCTPKAAELLKNGLFGAVKVCAVEKTTPKTNADRIRSMSDEELARFLGDEPPYFSTYEKYLDWLKQPVKED
jgi:Lar family restriction alleviation protein